MLETKKICTLDADFCNLSLRELVFTHSAERTGPIFRERFKWSAGSDAVLLISYCGIVLVPAYITNVLCHKMLILRELIF